ncbi:hypothetical protein GCM10009539_61320 [Cryptosporangium japonicum]|uniref:Uncharacterized protein n=1 Tax=Cryptosporangium japonicum TaxID=80872 RepID=A0ABN0UYG6_9ACTN
MQRLVGLVVGMVLVAVGAQGAIRLVVDHDDAGLLGWVPGGFWVRLACYLVAVVVGLGAAAWGAPKTQRTNRDR